MFSASTRNEDDAVGAGALACGRVLQRAWNWHTQRFSDVSAMLRCCVLPAITALKVIIKHSVEFVLFFLTSSCLMIKISAYIHAEIWPPSSGFWASQMAVRCVVLGSGSTSPPPPFFSFTFLLFCLCVEGWTLLIFEPQIRSIFQLCNTVPGFSEWRC